MDNISHFCGYCVLLVKSKQLLLLQLKCKFSYVNKKKILKLNLKFVQNK